MHVRTRRTVVINNNYCASEPFLCRKGAGINIYETSLSMSVDRWFRNAARYNEPETWQCTCKRRFGRSRWCREDLNNRRGRKLFFAAHAWARAGTSGEIKCRASARALMRTAATSECAWETVTAPPVFLCALFYTIFGTPRNKVKKKTDEPVQYATCADMRPCSLGNPPISTSSFLAASTLLFITIFTGNFWRKRPEKKRRSASGNVHCEFGIFIYAQNNKPESAFSQFPLIFTLKTCRIFRCNIGKYKKITMYTLQLCFQCNAYYTNSGLCNEQLLSLTHIIPKCDIIWF